jgi:hypothetical protein
MLFLSFVFFEVRLAAVHDINATAAVDGLQQATAYDTRRLAQQTRQGAPLYSQ